MYRDPQADAQQLRDQGLTDDLISQELSRRGYSSDDAAQALSVLNTVDMSPQEPSYPQSAAPQQPTMDNNTYERMEEIAESMIDEKWEELITEVKKIIEWKDRIEDRQNQIQSDLNKIKEDFKTLHLGVLGKLEDYDTQIRNVGTELKAVGKVFKDVIPEFVENVKELSATTKVLKHK